MNLYREVVGNLAEILQLVMDSTPRKAKEFSLNVAIKHGILSKKARNQHGFNLVNPWAERKVALHDHCLVYGDLDADRPKDGMPVTAETVVVKTTLDNKLFAFKITTPNPDSRLNIDFIEMNLNCVDERDLVSWIAAINGVVEKHKRDAEVRKYTELANVAIRSPMKCLKKLSTGTSFNTRYIWVNPEQKTFHWSKENSTSGLYKSLPCRAIQNVVFFDSGECPNFSIILRDPKSLPPKLFSQSMFALIPKSIDIKFEDDANPLTLYACNAFISVLKDLRNAR